jgi:hypothetical protein
MQEPVHHFQIALKQHLLLRSTVWPVEVGLIDVVEVWWRQSQRRMRRLRLGEVWEEVTRQVVVAGLLRERRGSVENDLAFCFRSWLLVHPPSGSADGKVALQDRFEVVPARLEVGHGHGASKLQCCNVVCLGSLCFGCCKECVYINLVVTWLE